MKKLIVAGFCLLSTTLTSAQTDSKKPLPIIDVHVHAMHAAPAAGPMCPWFLKDMPGGDPNLPTPKFLSTDCATPLYPAKSDADMQEQVIGTLKRLNMTMVVYGDATVIRNWQKAAPGRIIFRALG